MFESPASCFAFRRRFVQHDTAVKNKQRDPASFPAGPFVKLPELSGHCYAASAGTAGAAIAAASITGRDRRQTIAFRFGRIGLDERSLMQKRTFALLTVAVLFGLELSGREPIK